MAGTCAVLADLIVGFHFLVILFVVGSQILITIGWIWGWRWIRSLAFRLIHLGLVGFIAMQSIAGQLCPLTVWEYRLRQCAGQSVENNIPFLARLIRLIIFHDLPAWFFSIIYVAFGIMVIITFIIIPPVKHTSQRGT